MIASTGMGMMFQTMDHQNHPALSLLEISQSDAMPDKRLPTFIKRFHCHGRIFSVLDVKHSEVMYGMRRLDAPAIRLLCASFPYTVQAA